MRLVISLVAVAACLAAGEGADETSSELGLQELMSIKVTSVQRKEQSLAHSAAAVWVITREDIKRAGFSNVQEALRLAPGLHVARPSTSVWAVGSRGFNGQFANKLQVLVDGRSVYLPLNSGVFWDSMDLLLDDIDRIEVIRGPGAAIWGANAVTGVINIITRKAKDTVGSFLELGTGYGDRALARMRVGHQLRENLAFRVSGQFGYRDHMDSEGGVSGDSPWKTSRGGFRMDWDRNGNTGLTITGDLYRSSINETFNAPSIQPGRSVLSPTNVGATGGVLQGRWTQNGLRGQTTAQVNYGSATQSRTDYISGTARTLDLDLQHRLHLVRRHDLLLGYGYRTTGDSTEGTWRASLTPRDRRYSIHGITLQHEFEILPNRLFLTEGARVEHNTFGGFTLQPTARLLWAPAKEVSLWTAFSLARRTPSRMEQDLSLILGGVPTGYPVLLGKAPNPDFESEKLRAWEAGMRWQPLRRLSMDLSVFRNGFNDLEAWVESQPFFDRNVPGLVLPVRSTNLARGRAIGGEIAARADVTYRWRLTGSATFYDSHLHALLPSPVSTIRSDIFPGIQVQGHSTWDLNRKLQWNVSWYHTGALPGPQPGAHNRVDTSLRYRFSEWAGFSAGIQNLANARLNDFKPEDGLDPQYLRRTAWVRMQWWF